MHPALLKSSHEMHRWKSIDFDSSVISRSSDKNQRSKMELHIRGSKYRFSIHFASLTKKKYQTIRGLKATTRHKKCRVYAQLIEKENRKFIKWQTKINNCACDNNTEKIWHGRPEV